MNDKEDSEIVKVKEISIFTIIHQIKLFWKYCLSNWIVICAFGFGGAGVGLGLSFLIKPKYEAQVSFALIEKSSMGSGLASLASNFGFGSMLNNGGGAFSGDNLLEIMKSRHTIETTLLSEINFHGQQKTLADAYLEVNGLKEKWSDSPKMELRTLSYPMGQDPSTFTRVQDSVITVIWEKFIKSNILSVVRKDKKLDMVYLKFSSEDEEFSKNFVESLMNRTIEFYKETHTSQSRANVEILQHKADSIKELYEESLYGSATISSENINKASQVAMVPRLKQEYNTQLYGTVYAEVLKNLETLKFEMDRETPLFQIIDTPSYPLKKEKLGKIKGIVVGGFIGGLIIFFFLLIRYYFKKVSEKYNFEKD